MDVKKLALIGAVALAVIGCVIAAGCTSNQSPAIATPTTAPSTAEKIVGAWIAPYDNGNGLTGKSIHVFNADGTGYFAIYEDAGFTHLLNNGQLTWKKNDNGIDLCFGNITQTVTYNPDTDTYTDTFLPSVVKTRMDPITGIWSATGKDRNGNPCTFTDVLLDDGTGYNIITYDDVTVTGGKLIWTRNSDGTYLLKFPDSKESTWKLNPAGDEVTTTYGNVFKKQFADSYYYSPYLGKWVGTNSNNTRFFYGDGTGFRINCTTGDISRFTWTIPETGKLVCHLLSGKSSSTGESLAGTDKVFTYNRDTDSITSESTGYTYVHEHFLDLS